MTVDISTTIEADSTQINADDLTGTSRTVTITGVSKGTADQPVNLEVAEFPGKSYRPCKSMRRVLIYAWGTDASKYVGRQMTLFNDTTVKWAGQSVGGVRIKALSHIDKGFKLALTETRGKKTPFAVDRLPDTPDTPTLTPITDEGAVDFGRAIAEAATLDELDGIAADLKAWDLGGHRKSLLGAWKERRAVVEAGQPTQVALIPEGDK